MPIRSAGDSPGGAVLTSGPTGKMRSSRANVSAATARWPKPITSLRCRSGAPSEDAGEEGISLCDDFRTYRFWLLAGQPRTFGNTESKRVAQWRTSGKSSQVEGHHLRCQHDRFHHVYALWQRHCRSVCANRLPAQLSKRFGNLAGHVDTAGRRPLVWSKNSEPG